MRVGPAVKLSALRAIGWDVWDPIGIRDMVSDDFATGPADEYDRYLIAAFAKAQNGKSADDIAAYLNEIASIHMGLTCSIDGGAAEREAARLLVALAQSLDVIS